MSIINNSNRNIIMLVRNNMINR